MAGRPSKPTELLKKQETFRSDRHEDRVFVANKLANTPSKWLTAKEKKVWEKWYETLQNNEILKETDEVAFGLLCKVFHRVESLAKEFKNPEDYTMEYISDVGSKVTKVNPRYTILVEAEKNLLKLLTEFGMTPVSRNKIKSALREEEDPFQKLLNM